MSSFNTTCVPWVQTTACSQRLAQQFSVMCNVFLGTTIVTMIVLSISIMRRLWLVSQQTVMFKIIAPQLLVWGTLQIFYLSVRGFSIHNFKVPTVLLTLANLQSSTILGSTVLGLIVVWITIHNTEFRTRNYQIQYGVIAGGFILLVMISSALTGVKPSYYFIGMRVTLIIWSAYLIICIILLLIYGSKIYRDAGRSVDKEDANVIRVRREIPIILTVWTVIFSFVLVLFIFYASATELIERSTFWPLLIWGSFWTGSTVYVNTLSIYFWRIPTVN